MIRKRGWSVHSQVEYLWDEGSKEWFVNVERLGH